MGDFTFIPTTIYAMTLNEKNNYKTQREMIDRIQGLARYKKGTVSKKLLFYIF